MTSIVEIAACLRCRTRHESHPSACPQVKAIEYDSDGNITRTEYLVPVDFHRSNSPEQPEPGYAKFKASGDQS